MAKAENFALQKRPWQAYGAMDSAFDYYQKEVDSSILKQAKELEAKYGLLEKDNQIKSLALTNQTVENTRARQRRTMVGIICGTTIIGLFSLWTWRKKHIKRKIREESLRQQLLRGQIASHFLFSSVSGLQQLIRKENIDEANKFVQRLADLFRLSLENARQPFVALKHELDALSSYLMIQQSLYNNQFEYHIEIKDIDDQELILIPPMLLQPFIENSILHGFVGQKEKGQINISIQKKNETLYCVIEDNGRGFQSVGDKFHKRPLSTIINKERLEILSRQTKTPAQLQIIDKKATIGQSGVRVELVLPSQTAH